MPASEAQKKASRKWDEANRDRYWRLIVRFPAEERERVQQAAESKGLSTSEYVRQLILRDLES